MMADTTWHVDRFTCLDDIKGKDRHNPLLVLAVVMRNGGRFSVFDAADDRMARSLAVIAHSDWVTVKPDVGYPYTVLELTKAGRFALGHPLQHTESGK